MFENGETTTLKSRMFFSVILQKTLSYSFLIPAPCMFEKLNPIFCTVYPKIRVRNVGEPEWGGRS